MHKEIRAAIQYWGTPDVLISTLNDDGTVNVAPMSSAWWLGWSCMLGFDASSHTVRNLERERECVLNLPSDAMFDVVNRLAMTTGSSRLPLHKQLLGYRYVQDKLGLADLSTTNSVEVKAPRIVACPVQLEARVVSVRRFAEGDPRMAVPARAVEVRIVRVHVDDAILADENKVDPFKWRPLLMSFRHLFGLSQVRHPSELARGDESAYSPENRGLVVRTAAKALRALGERRYAPPDELNRGDR
jgi:flavin reductase (DIM6/NTAB) family NADH-FMN oxidoreductase RutF